MGTAERKPAAASWGRVKPVEGSTVEVALTICLPRS
jgi:hypothetical protein